MQTPTLQESNPSAADEEFGAFRADAAIARSTVAAAHGNSR